MPIVDVCPPPPPSDGRPIRRVIRDAIALLPRRPGSLKIGPQIQPPTPRPPPPTEGQNEQWREANRRRQRPTIRYRGLVPPPPPPASKPPTPPPPPPFQCVSAPPPPLARAQAFDGAVGGLRPRKAPHSTSLTRGVGAEQPPPKGPVSDRVLAVGPTGVVVGGGGASHRDRPRPMAPDVPFGRGGGAGGLGPSRPDRRVRAAPPPPPQARPRAAAPVPCRRSSTRIARRSCAPRWTASLWSWRSWGLCRCWCTSPPTRYAPGAVCAGDGEGCSRAHLGSVPCGVQPGV